MLFGLTKKDVQAIILAEDTVRFTVVSFFWQMIGFIGLYLISKSDLCPVLTSSGLFIPIVLIIIGFLIQASSKLVIKEKRNHEKIDKKIIIICGSIVLSVCMIIVDWKLALFILAVILGKYIWIDFVFDYKGIVTSIKEYKAQYFYFGFNSISIAINILSQFASTFVISTVVLGVIDWTPLWVQIITMVLSYISIMMWAVAFHKDRKARFDYETDEIKESVEESKEKE